MATWDWKKILEQSDTEIENFVNSLSEEELANLSESAVDYFNKAEGDVDPEEQESYLPRSAAERNWVDHHTVQVFDPLGYGEGGIGIVTDPENSFDRIRRLLRNR